MAVLADAGRTGVAQVSADAIVETVPPISTPAGRQKCAAFAGLETRDTACLDVCATGLAMKNPRWPIRLGGISFRYCWVAGHAF